MFDRFERAMVSGRSAALQRPVFTALEDGSLSASEIRRLLTVVCANARLLTESVDAWAHRSGERCTALGFADVGAQLQLDALRRQDRHAALVGFSQRLIGDGNPATLPAVGPLIELHESVIESDTPFAKLAIDHEVERLWAEFWSRVGGAKGAGGVPAFSQQLATIDAWSDDAVRQSALFRCRLRAFVSEHPESVDELTHFGLLVIARMGEMLDACWALAVDDGASSATA